MESKAQCSASKDVSMMGCLRASIVMVLLMTLLLGIIYPLLVTAIADGVLHRKSQGSLIERDGKVIGSELLGQEFTAPKYFWGRVSATSPAYNAASSGASNLSPANPKLLEAVNARALLLQKSDPTHRGHIPAALVTASASGLDPHIPRIAVEYQVPRVAKARGIKDEEVLAVMREHIERPFWGLFGVEYVNVLQLNLALDEMGGNRK